MSPSALLVMLAPEIGGENSGKKPVTTAQIQLLNSTLCEVIETDERFQNYINSTAILNKHPNGCINTYLKMLYDPFEDYYSYDKSDEIIHDERAHDTLSFLTQTVTFSNFCRNDIRRMLRKNFRDIAFTRLYCLSENNPTEHANLPASKCVHVCPEIKGMKGSYVTYNSVKDTYLSQNWHNEKDQSGISKFLFIGSRAFLGGMILPTGNLVIKLNLILKLLETDVEKAKAALIGMFNVFADFYDSFLGINLASQLRDCKIDSLKYVFNEIDDELCDHHSMLSGAIRRKEKKEKVFQILDERVTYAVEDYWKKSTRRTLFTATDDTNMYRRMMNDYFKQFSRVLRAEKAKAFGEGLIFSNKISALGWNVVDDVNLIPSNCRISMDEGWWYKDIDLVPDKLTWHNHVYIIPKAHRKFKIDRLFINSEGRVGAGGSHPNVDFSGWVCLGDLGALDLIASPTSAISVYLEKLETLLEIVNYDSAYNNDKRTELIKKCKILDTSSTLTEWTGGAEGLGFKKLNLDANVEFIAASASINSVVNPDRIDLIVDGEPVYDGSTEIPNQSEDFEQAFEAIDTIRKTCRDMDTFGLKTCPRVVWLHPNNQSMVGALDTYGKIVFFYIKDKYSRPKRIKVPQFEAVIKISEFYENTAEKGYWERTGTFESRQAVIGAIKHV